MDLCVKAYDPTRVVRPYDRIPGTAFFPGGDGLWDPKAEFPAAPVMFLGHNFDSEAAFKRSLERGAEDVYGNKTWTTLRRWIECAGLHPTECFFTNALMGLKVGASSGILSAARPYREQCQAFLAQQIRVVQPRAIVTLGSEAPKLLKLLSRELTAAWSAPGKSFSLRTIDHSQSHTVRDVSFQGRSCGQEPVDFVVRCPVVVAVTHPSYWASRRADAEILCRALATVAR
jgi:hypothetical protein